MSARSRQTQLLEYLARNPEVTVDEACLLLDASPATVRRDFQRLEDTGRATRTWGGVRALELFPVPTVTNGAMPPYTLRGTRNSEAKRKIAEGAVRLDDVVMNDPGALITIPAGETRKLSLGKKKHGILKGA